MLVSLALALSFQSAPTALDAPGLASKLAGNGGAVVALLDGETAVVGEDAAGSLKKSNVRLVPGPVSIAFSDHISPKVAYAIAKYRQAPALEAPKVDSFPKGAVANGTVTVKSANGFRLQTLKSATWSTPLTISTAFNDEGVGAIVLAADVKDLPETDFLAAVARAVGGRFRQTQKGFRIEPNGAELRSRLLKTIQLIRASPKIPTQVAGPTDFAADDEEMPVRPVRNAGPAKKMTIPGVQARLDLARDVINRLTPEVLEPFFEGTQSVMGVSLVGASDIQADVVRFLEIDAAGNSAELQRIRRQLQMVSSNDPGQVDVGLGFAMTVKLNLLAGRQVRTVRVEAL
ncbi:MAG: hypothetical protein C4320_03765 [Armatimonadota bacterium]